MQELRFSKDKRTRILQESKVGKKVVVICREFGISNATFNILESSIFLCCLIKLKAKVDDFEAAVD